MIEQYTSFAVIIRRHERHPGGVIADVYPGHDGDLNDQFAVAVETDGQLTVMRLAIRQP